jgi:hypothetical protein
MDAIISAAISSPSEIFIERLRGLPSEDGRRLVAESSARTTGADLVELMADGGGVRTCNLTRPEPGEGVPVTPIRQLPRGNRNTARREVRLVTAKRPGMLSERVTDLHIAPYNQTDNDGISGRRPHTAATRGSRKLRRRDSAGNSVVHLYRPAIPLRTMRRPAPISRTYRRLRTAEGIPTGSSSAPN